MTATPDHRQAASGALPEQQDRADVQVFFGTATDTECRIYAQDERRPGARAALTGFVRGPFCQYANTLPATYPFRPAAAAAGLVEAWVPDPCFWTPAMPYIYQYTLERDVHGNAEVIRGQIGIRRLGTEGSNLRFDGKRWVLRAAQTPELAAPDIDAWRQASLAAVVRRPGRSLCQLATTAGMLLVADLTNAVDVELELRQLRNFAAVGMAILDRHAPPLDPRSVARNLLLGQRFGAGEPIVPADWADVAFCEVGQSQPECLARPSRPIPLIALRSGGESLLPQSARALCDLLQRDLADEIANWAGYVV